MIVKKNILRGSVLKKGNLYWKNCSEYSGTINTETHFVDCPGEAHRNEFIDNCGICAPRWGVIEIPIEYKTLSEYRDSLHKNDE